MEKRFKRALAEGKNHARVRRPLTWEMIRVVKESIGERGIGGRIGQTWTNQLLLRATELSAEEGRKLGRRDVAFFEKGVQLGARKEEGTDTIKIHFKGERGPGPGDIKAVAVRTTGLGLGGRGRGAGEGCSGFNGGTGRVLHGRAVLGKQNAPRTAYRSGGKRRA